MTNILQGQKKEQFVATTGSFGNVVSTGSVTAGTNVTTPASHATTAGSPYMQGFTVLAPAADVIISGGMWVAGSKTVTIAAPASCPNPIGVCMANVASGGQPTILLNGLAYMVADGAITYGQALMVGAGGALNTVRPITGSPIPSVAAIAVNDAASGAAALVRIC
jgi:hypothetical protein